MKAKDLRFEQTSYCSPEQYDVYAEDIPCNIGYVRLRHGGLRAEYCGKVIYTNSYSSNEADGRFFSEKLRKSELKKIAKKIAKAYNEDHSEETFYESED